MARNVIRKNVEKGLFLISEKGELSERFLIVKVSNLKHEEKEFLYWNYKSNVKGKIKITETEELEVSGETLLINNEVTLDDTKFIYDLLEQGLEYRDTLFQVLDELEDLFNRMKNSGKNFYQGLFGELYFISLFNDKKINMAKYFQAKPYDIFDFNLVDINRMVEIKTTTRRNGDVFLIHGKQINIEKEVFFVNFKLVESDTGESCLSLYKNLIHLFDKTCWIHKIFSDRSFKNGLRDFKFNLEESKFDIYNSKDFKNTVELKNDRVLNYSFEFDFAGLKKYQLEDIAKESKEIFFKYI